MPGPEFFFEGRPSSGQNGAGRLPPAPALICACGHAPGSAPRPPRSSRVSSRWDRSGSSLPSTPRVSTFAHFSIWPSRSVWGFVARLATYCLLCPSCAGTLLGTLAPTDESLPPTLRRPPVPGVDPHRSPRWNLREAMPPSCKLIKPAKDYYVWPDTGLERFARCLVCNSCLSETGEGAQA